MTSDKDYYRILGVLDDAEDIVIKAAYRALAQRYHPDRWQGDAAEATRRMAEINAAYAILSDTVKRAAYDSTRDKNQFRDEPPDLEPRRSEAPRPEPSSYKKHRQNSEADAGEEAKSKPETDIQSGYAAAKGFRERAGRGSTSSFSSSKENEPIRHATSHRPGFIRRSWLMLLFAITLMVLTFLIYLLPTLYRDWKIWGQLIIWGVGAKYCYTALFRSNIPESPKKSV